MIGFVIQTVSIAVGVYVGMVLVVISQLLLEEAVL